MFLLQLKWNSLKNKIDTATSMEFNSNQELTNGLNSTVFFINVHK